MALTFALYTDAGLTAALTTDLIHAKAASVASEDKDFRLYLGSTDTSVKLTRATSPGVNEIQVVPTDSDTGTDPATTAIKLALSSVALDSATPGASLDLGTEIAGGTSTAVEFWVRVTNELAGVDSDATLGIEITDVSEVPA